MKRGWTWTRRGAHVSPGTACLRKDKPFEFMLAVVAQPGLPIHRKSDHGSRNVSTRKTLCLSDSRMTVQSPPSPLLIKEGSLKVREPLGPHRGRGNFILMDLPLPLVENNARIFPSVHSRSVFESQKEPHFRKEFCAPPFVENRVASVSDAIECYRV